VEHQSGAGDEEGAMSDATSTYEVSPDGKRLRLERETFMGATDYKRLQVP
jgi:hypothetical protein